MRNFFKRKTEEQLQEINPYIVYIDSEFQNVVFQEYIIEYLEKNTKREYRTWVDQHQIYVQTDIVKDDKKGRLEYNLFQFIATDNKITIQYQQIKEDEHATSKEVKDIDLFETKSKLVAHVLKYINERLDDSFLELHLQNKMEFITSLSALEKNYLLAQTKNNEIYLLCLGITNLKSSLFEVHKKKQYNFVLTSMRNLIFESDGKSFSIYDVTGNSLDFKEKIGKDEITASSFSFETELFNDSLFAYYKHLYNEVAEKRVELYTDLLFDKYNSKEAHLNYIKKLYELKTSKDDKLTTTLKSMLVFQFPKKQCAKELLISQDFLDSMYTTNTFGNTLFNVLRSWNILPVEQYNFLQLLSSQNSNFKLKNLDVFYDAAIAGVLNQKNLPKNALQYRIQHLTYLKDTKQYKKAIPFYEYVLESLEDDSILELISDAKTDVLNGEDCNPLRIRLLEELSEIKVSLKQSNKKELLELATLQPMVPDRLTQLVANGVESKKAQEILSLLMSDTWNTFTTNSNDTTIKKYNKKTLFDLVVPDCFKEAKTFTDSFANLIAQVTPPDYKQVTSFSEKLSATNYPQAYQVLEELAGQLQMDMPECYIGNGNFSRGIIGVEATPNFLILGKAHLEKATSFYFTRNELKCNLAQELTHILFGHTRLTSKDVWRGAKNKGMSAAGVLLVALPMVSTVGSFAGKFIDMTNYTKLFSGVDKVTNVVGKGQSAIEYGEKITDKFTSEDKESELLATSRLMEISADRVGLLVTNDLGGCLLTLLKNGSDFETTSNQINKSGLHTYLSKQNEQGEFVYQEMIIRIKTLFNFYLKHC